MKFLRAHWYDIGGVLAVITLIGIMASFAGLSDYRLLMWLSLVSLFFHQMEEYRIVGTFPGMINSRMFKSDIPDRYPLNTNTSLIINVGVGWTLYLAAALAGERLVWLGMAAILVSLGNILAHTLVFNIRGKTLYNAGLATSWLFLAPCVFFFFRIVTEQHLATATDYAIGVPLGIIINVLLVVKLITWLADRHTRYAFSTRNLLPGDRNAPQG